MANDSPSNGWQGRNTGPSEVQHRWAAGATEDSNPQRLKGAARTRRGVWLLFAFTLIASTLLVYNLSYYPTRTPVVTICLKDYAWPLCPNAGVVEDQNGLELLSNESIDVEDISSRWKNRQAGLNRLEEYLDELIGEKKHRGPVMIYINGHGAVDQSGEPCLILPGYDPQAQDQWLRIRELVSRVKKKVKPYTKVVMIVDCVKFRRNWRLGVLVNSWQEQMESLVQEIDWENLSVLSSVGKHQINEFSAGLVGTSFGHYLKLGLAGRADEDSEKNKSSKGNNDGYVSLKELEAYVRFNVAQRCKTNNGDLQQPEVLSTSTTEVVLVKSLSDPSSVEEVVPPDSSRELSLEDIGLHWRNLEQLKSGALLRIRPQLIHQIENQLIYLEQLNAAGQGYVSATRRLHGDLGREFKRVKEEYGSAKLPKLAAYFNDAVPKSIRANEWVGLLNDKEANRLREDFENISGSSTELLYHVGERIGKKQLLESFIGRWLNRLNQAEVWPNTEASTLFAKLHGLSEQAGLPDDIRSHPWSIRELESADQTRRVAFDHLFIGGANSQKTINDAVGVYERIVNNQNSTQNRIKSYFAQRDRAIALFVPLADWHTRWLSPSTQVDEGEWQANLDENKLRLSDLAKRLRTHSELLASPTVEDQMASLDESHREITRELDRLEKDFNKNCNDLIEQSTMDGDLVFDLKSILRSPLIPADKRIELLQKLQIAQIRLAEETDGNSQGSGSERSGKQSAGSSNSISMERLVDRLSGEAELQSSLDLNPFLAFIEISSKSEDGGSKSQFQLSAEVSQKLRRCFERENFIQAAKTRTQTLKIPVELSGRVEKHLAAYFQRQSFALIDSKEIEFDFVNELQRFELQHAFMWQAERAGLDFYGRIPGRAQGPDSDYVFEIMAKSYLGLAAEIYTFSSGLEDRSAEFTKRLDELKTSAGSTVQLNVLPKLEIDAAAESEIEVKVSSGNPQIGTKAISGSLSVHLESPGNRRWGPGFDMDYPVSESSKSKTWPVNTGEHNRLVAFFRGHQFPKPVMANSLGGHRVEILNRKNQKSDVTLVGDRMGPSSVMFIMDCSQSMSKSIQVELIGEEKVPRLKLAKGALSTMLDILAQRNDTRVGVRFFGHRSGWSTSSPPIRLQQKNYAEKIPDSLKPENDVELALPVGRFTANQARQIKTRMQTIAPWGQSPLNLALVQAMDDFELEEQGTQKSIVVITDGLNYQFSPSTETAESTRITSLEDVLTKVGSTGIPIYILGFGIAQNEKEEAAKSFYSIANKSGGEFFPVESGKELLQTMRKQLQLGTYNVFDPDDNPIDRVSERLPRLYETVDLSQLGQYRLASESTEQKFVIEGGESLLFQLTEGPTISSVPFDDQVLQKQTLSHNERSEKIVFRAHRPKQVRDNVEFPLSFQFQNVAFTPRPKDLWIEISPVFESDSLPEKRSTKYVFYDPDFEARKPVPVINCKIGAWPKSAKRARIRAFCKFEKSIPTQMIPVNELEDWKPADGFPGMRCRVEVDAADLGKKSSIRIVEEHKSGSNGIYSTRIDLVHTTGILPNRILRQFDSENNVGVHTYYFDAKTVGEIIKSKDTFVAITRREIIQSEAWKANDEVEVRIFPDVELLPLDAATGVR